MKKVWQLHQQLVNGTNWTPLEWLLFFVLIPCSVAYGAMGWFRNFLYDVGIFSSYRANIPVLSVGNLAVGGTGKTPVADFLVKEFQQRGKRPVIISRGYGGSFSRDVGVVSNGDKILMTAVEAGDEPFLLATKNPSCAVLIAKRRAAGIKYVENNIDADLIILDDAFQHRAVARDADIVLLDATRPLGNGWPLPVGNLREFRGSLKRADLVIMTRAVKGTPEYFQDRPVYTSRHQLAESAVSLKGEIVRIDSLKDLRLLAFAGIANPESFFSSLKKAELNLGCTLSFPDHVDYSQESVMEQLQSMSRNADALMTTEKDAVKLSAELFDLPCYQLPMTVSIDNPDGLMEAVFKHLWSK
ncbi:MAG: tetraacyldisaccharide 4'-kinase [Desulfuromonadales bacterium]|nr:tetraacyldisaccharide 4'-kinase [Desulfuromonadales bacterium]MBN2791297.1 tetraacyldisaccharide 4'-kinase [Desulfuromonadales bacterium]